MQFRTSVIASIIRLINLPAAGSGYRNMMYVPSRKRSVKDIVERVSMMSVEMGRWQTMIGLQCSVGDHKLMLVDLQKEITMHSQLVQTLAKEMMAIHAGEALTSERISEMVQEVEDAAAPKKRKREDAPSRAGAVDNPAVAGDLTEEGKRMIALQSESLLQQMKRMQREHAAKEQEAGSVTRHGKKLRKFKAKSFPDPEATPPRTPRKVAPPSKAKSTSATDREQIAADRQLAAHLEAGTSQPSTASQTPPPGAPPPSPKPGASTSSARSRASPTDAADVSLDDLPDL